MSITLEQIGKGHKQTKNCFSGRADSDGTVQNNSYCPDAIPSDADNGFVIANNPIEELEEDNKDDNK